MALILGIGSAILIVMAAGLFFMTPPTHVHLDPNDAKALSGAPMVSSATAIDSSPDASADNAQTSGYADAAPLRAAEELPPAPAPGSPRAQADRSVYLATRALAGSARWTLAASDNDQSVPATLRDFSCAMGVTLNEASAPSTTALLNRAEQESRQLVNQSKQVYARKRPYLLEPGAICVPRSSEMDSSPDYPSGHATWGWMTALLLAEIAPDKANAVLVRGRAYSESRVICGVHSVSAMEAGRSQGAALAAALHASSTFRADLDMARAELTNLRRTGLAPDPGACAAETRLTGASYF